MSRVKHVERINHLPLKFGVLPTIRKYAPATEDCVSFARQWIPFLLEFLRASSLFRQTDLLSYNLLLGQRHPYQSHCIYETTVEVSGDSAIDLPMLVRVWSQSSCGSLLGRVGEGLGRSKLRGLYSQGYQIL